MPASKDDELVMRVKNLTFLLIILLGALAASAGELVIKGVYKGKNLYVQNTVGQSTEFCTIEVYVNNVLALSNPQSTSYEIDLSEAKFNDPIFVKIKHKDGLKPTVLNPHVIKKMSKFHFVSFTVDEFNINWSTKGEVIGGTHLLEHYVNNEWLTLYRVSGHAVRNVTNYNHTIKHHAGLNKYRVKYLDKHHKVYYTKEIEFVSQDEPITFYPKRVTRLITLSHHASYEIMDAYGKVIRKGKGKLIDCTALKSGLYYLNINNQTDKFLKK